MKTKKLLMLSLVILGGIIKMNAQSNNVVLTTKQTSPVVDNTLVGADAGTNVASDGINPESGHENTFVGSQSGNASTFGYRNAYFGAYSGSLMAGYVGENTFIGPRSGRDRVSGDLNTFIGAAAGRGVQYAGQNAGNRNVFVGAAAGLEAVGNDNCFLGWQAGYKNYGVNNISIGTSAGYGAGSTSTGSQNLFIGYESGLNFTSGYNNTFLGFRSGNKITTGYGNIFLGGLSGYANTNGQQNVFIGDASGGANVGGKNNVYLGATSGANNNGTGNIFIGYQAGKVHTTLNNSLIISNVDTYTPLVAGDFANQNLTFNVSKDPYSRVTISSYSNSSYPGNSGLRFANVNSASALTTNPGTGVLSVAANGDVILVPDQIGTGGATLIANGANTTVAGTGVTGSPYLINAKNIYTDDGTLSANRTVNMNSNKMIFDTQADGRIYIGDTNATSPFTVGTGNNFPPVSIPESNYRLLVEGGILTEKVKIALRSSSADWADYVFAQDYKLMPLKEVENFVKENKHLPGIDSANDLAKKGLDVADMQAKQMGKIEELTLYVIKQDKEIEELKAQVKALLEKK